jgi:hypothetical protein
MGWSPQTEQPTTESRSVKAIPAAKHETGGEPLLFMLLAIRPDRRHILQSESRRRTRRNHDNVDVVFIDVARSALRRRPERPAHLGKQQIRRIQLV